MHAVLPTQFVKTFTAFLLALSFIFASPAFASELPSSPVATTGSVVELPDSLEPVNPSYDAVSSISSQPQSDSRSERPFSTTNPRYYQNIVLIGAFAATVIISLMIAIIVGVTYARNERPRF